MAAQSMIEIDFRKENEKLPRLATVAKFFTVLMAILTFAALALPQAAVG